MISELAKGDYEDLIAAGLPATLEDFDRLNTIALRLTDGPETTCANFPRIGWAGDVPFFEPTVQAIMWYFEIAERLDADEETKAVTFWAFALAHAREPHFFDALTTPDAVRDAVSAWAKSLAATKEEVARAVRYAVNGFDDALVAKNDSPTSSPRFRADRTAAARNMAEVERRLAQAAGLTHVPPDGWKCETLSRMGRACEAAANELGRRFVRDEARLRADYDLTLREIRRRLKAEKNSETAAP